MKRMHRRRRPRTRRRWAEHADAALYVVAALWLVFAVDWLLPADLRMHGIRPRSVPGLWGIPCAPFLHGGIEHLLTNSGALFGLLLISFAYSRRLTWWAIAASIFPAGFCVWLLAPAPTVHIGASGVIFGLIGFLVAVGFVRRDWRSLLLSLLVLFFYGGAILSLADRVPGVSWQMHLAGYVFGTLTAWRTRRLSR